MKRILVIEDNAPLGAMLVKYLSRFGYEVELVMTPVGVLNMVRGFRPDMIMLGFGMSPCGRDTIARLLHDHRDRLEPLEVLLFTPGDEKVCDQTGCKPPADGLFTFNGSADGLERILERCLPPAAQAMD